MRYEYGINFGIGPLDSTAFMTSVGHKLMKSGWGEDVDPERGGIKQTSFLRQVCGREFSFAMAHFRYTHIRPIRRLPVLSSLQKIIIYCNCEVHKVLWLVHFIRLAPLST